MTQLKDLWARLRHKIPIFGGHFVCACSEAHWLLSSGGFLSASFHPLYPWDQLRRKVGGLSSSGVSAVNLMQNLDPPLSSGWISSSSGLHWAYFHLETLLKFLLQVVQMLKPYYYAPMVSPDISVKFPSTQILNPLIEGLSIKYNVNKTSTGTLSVAFAGLLTATKTVCYNTGVFAKLYENQLNLKLYFLVSSSDSQWHDHLAVIALQES